MQMNRKNGAPSNLVTLTDIKERPDDLYTASQVASALQLNVDTVYRLGAMNKLRRKTLGPHGGKTKFVGRDVLVYVFGDAA